MPDDRTDVSENIQMLIILQYVLCEDIFECFGGYFIQENQTTDEISKRILEQLNNHLSKATKMIALTFDGSNIIQGKNRRVQAKIEAVPSSLYFMNINFV